MTQLSDLKPNAKNPRKITQKQFDRLEKTLLDLGDLSGIVYNRKLKSLVGGHMRTRVFQKVKSNIEIITQHDKPDSQGTVAIGFLDVNGTKYAYREVEFTQEEHDKAMLVANKAGGDFDWDMIANNWDEAFLKDAGFEDWELHEDTEETTHSQIDELSEITLVKVKCKSDDKDNISSLIDKCLKETSLEYKLI